MLKELEYSKKLEAVGFSRKQSEALLNLLVNAMTDEIATKTDVRNLGQDMALGFAKQSVERAEAETRSTQNVVDKLIKILGLYSAINVFLGGIFLFAIKFLKL